MCVQTCGMRPMHRTAADIVVNVKRPAGCADPDLRAFVVDWASPVAQQLVLAWPGQQGFKRACSRLWDSDRMDGLPAGLGMLGENLLHGLLADCGCVLEGLLLAEGGGALSDQPTLRDFQFRSGVRRCSALCQTCRSSVKTRARTSSAACTCSGFRRTFQPWTACLLHWTRREG